MKGENGTRVPSLPLALPDWLTQADGLRPGETSMEYLARHSHSFRYAARFLPPPYDVLVADVYAFCRFTDDLVDTANESPDVLRARLEEWRALARRAYEGQASGFVLLDKPIGEMARRDIPFELADELIEGVAMDLEDPSQPPRRYATIAELDRYSYRVASVVGLWLTRLVGVRDPQALERASEMGLAMQLTNILRDVGEDRARGRLYLPLDVLARHGIDAEALMAGRPGDPLPVHWAAAMEELMASAETRYARALEALSALPEFFRRPVGVSALVYRDIHRSLRRNGYDNLNRRAFVTRARKVWLGLRARLLPIAEGHWGESTNPCGSQASMRRTPSPRARQLTRWAAAIGLAALCLGAIAYPQSAQSAPSPRTSPSSRASTSVSGLGDAEVTARRDLATTESALRETPRSADLLLRRLRLLHALSVQDERLLAPARSARAEAAAALGASPLLLAYRGALDVVEARHGFWPRERMTPLQRGLPLLDSAVRLDPASAEIRYLRLTSGYYLPFFLGRKPQVREDFAALSELLPGARREFPREWYAAVTGFVLDKGDLSPRERERLRRSLRDGDDGAGVENRDLSDVGTGGTSGASKSRPDYSRIP